MFVKVFFSPLREISCKLKLLIGLLQSDQISINLLSFSFRAKPPIVNTASTKNETMIKKMSSTQPNYSIHLHPQPQAKTLIRQMPLGVQEQRQRTPSPLTVSGRERPISSAVPFQRLSPTRPQITRSSQPEIHQVI